MKMRGVGNRVANDRHEEHLQNVSYLLVGEVRDTHDTTVPRRVPCGELLDALDVGAQHHMLLHHIHNVTRRHLLAAVTPPDRIHFVQRIAVGVRSSVVHQVHHLAGHVWRTSAGLCRGWARRMGIALQASHGQYSAGLPPHSKAQSLDEKTANNQAGQLLEYGLWPSRATVPSNANATLVAGSLNMGSTFLLQNPSREESRVVVFIENIEYIGR